MSFGSFSQKRKYEFYGTTHPNDNFIARLVSRIRCFSCVATSLRESGVMAFLKMFRQMSRRQTFMIERLVQQKYK